MEEADPPGTPIAHPFKVGDFVHVFEGACKGLHLLRLILCVLSCASCLARFSLPLLRLVLCSVVDYCFLAFTICLSFICNKCKGAQDSRIR